GGSVAFGGDGIVRFLHLRVFAKVKVCRSRGIVNAVGSSYKPFLRLQFGQGSDARLQVSRNSFERNNTETRVLESPLIHAWRSARWFRRCDWILVPSAQSAFCSHTRAAKDWWNRHAAD